MRRLAVLALLASASGCVIGSWRMHPGAARARVADVCVTDPVCDASGCHCEGTTEVVNPGPLGFSVGATVGESTGAIGSDTASLTYGAQGGMNYVLPGDRIALGLDATYQLARMSQPGGKIDDGIGGWGANAVAQLALGGRLVVHAGVGFLRAHYAVGLGEAGETDSPTLFAPRALVGATLVLARSERRDLFLTVQGAATHVPGSSVGASDGLTQLTATAALGIALQP